MNLNKKTALITGASAGIGKKSAKELAKKGVNLILFARRYEKLEKLKEKLKKYNIAIDIYKVNVSNFKDVEIAINDIKNKNLIPNILINNAGLSQGLDPIDKADITDWNNMIDVNIKGLLYISRLVIPMLKNQKNAHIINLGSIAGHEVYAGGSVYNATKFAVHALNKAMNIDLFGTDVRVTCIAPGAVETEFSLVRFHGDKDKANNVYNGFKPLKAKDVVKTILFTLSQPKHVNIQEIFLTPTAQRTTYLTYKRQ